MAGWDFDKVDAILAERRDATKKHRSLNKELRSSLAPESKAADLAAEAAAQRVLATLGAVCAGLAMQGQVQAFGSFTSGLKRGGSDLDCSLMTPEAQTQEEQCEMLSRIMEKLPSECQHVTKVFSTRTPLIKFVDADSGLDVDFCINNRLGMRNTMLLSAYCEYDVRVRQLARFVKDWSKANHLVGTPEGYLNSYAYMLLVLFYLQQCSPPVLPHNLQTLATESVPVDDCKWGCQDRWETKFVEDVGSLSQSPNFLSLAELLIGFFEFYVAFDWERHAVCLRLSRHGRRVDKFNLQTATNKDQWYIEDPFDQRHNLGSQCTAAGKKRLLELMQEAASSLANGGSWTELCKTRQTTAFFLRCRITQAVTPEMLLEEFEPFSLSRLHFPRQRKPKTPEWMEPQVFLEFPSASARRAALCRNEDVIGDCQVSMIDSSELGCREAAALWEYELFQVGASFLGVQSTAFESAVDVPIPSDDDDDDLA